MNEPTTNELKVEQTHPETYETLEEVVRAGAKKMLIAALEAEIAPLRQKRDEMATIARFFYTQQ